ncbi:hypothetical protein Tco_0483311, partial [Tanacetum coccineum]
MCESDSDSEPLNKQIAPKTELTLEQTQEDVSDEVLAET